MFYCILKESGKSNTRVLKASDFWIKDGIFYWVHHLHQPDLQPLTFIIEPMRYLMTYTSCTSTSAEQQSCGPRTINTARFESRSRIGSRKVLRSTRSSTTTTERKMVRAWYHDGEANDPSDPHMLTPGQFLSVQQLKDEIGVELMKFDAATLDTNVEYLSLKKERGYSVEDYIIICKDYIDIDSRLEPDYNKRMKIFNSEHLHPDEEIRFVSAGSGFFDMRSRDDKWIRLELSQGDLMIIPGGVYHRFFLDHKGYVKLRRLFSEEPSWVAFHRPEGDTHTVRQKYIQDHRVMITAE
ncbi:hypothetical protein RRG08_053830 [Elysia crispata]|uniref:Acireductone dioxygenase n=1 Tax=Elysia crispata TaxID=231223 RepID=A0AAE1AAK8_9GAST|nr:hypothetical protein RRG08_053830 [Elysia crispata]